MSIDPRLERIIRAGSPRGICPWCQYGPLEGHDRECPVQKGEIVYREIDVANLPPLPEPLRGVFKTRTNVRR